MGGGWKEVEPAHLTLVEEARVGDAGVVGDFEGSWSLWSWGFSILVQEWRESETAGRKERKSCCMQFNLEASRAEMKEFWSYMIGPILS